MASNRGGMQKTYAGVCAGALRQHERAQRRPSAFDRRRQSEGAKRGRLARLLEKADEGTHPDPWAGFCELDRD